MMSLVSVLGCGTWLFPIEEQLYCVRRPGRRRRRREQRPQWPVKQCVTLRQHRAWAEVTHRKSPPWGSVQVTSAGKGCRRATSLPETVPPGHSGEALPYPILRRLSSTSESRAAPGASALRRGGVILGAREEPEPPAGSAGGAGGGAAMPPSLPKTACPESSPPRSRG